MRWRELGQCHTRFQDDGRERNFCQRHVFYGCSFRGRGKLEVVEARHGYSASRSGGRELESERPVIYREEGIL